MIRGNDATYVGDDDYTTDDCPRCKQPLRPLRVLNSRSRVDNKTLICSDCGNTEALWDFYFPSRPLPPLSERIPVT